MAVRSTPGRWSLALAMTLGGLGVASAQPTITGQPQDQFVNAGESATLAVAASGLPPLTHQWLCNETVLAHATNGVLLFTNAQPSLNGNYVVVVSDSSGCVTSRVAQVKVFVPTPHALSYLAVKPGEPAVLSLAGETTALFAPYYDLYPVEVSPNLVDWSPLVTLHRINTALVPLTFVDTNATACDRRFYRMATNASPTPLPPLTGRYAVGRCSRLLTDHSRTNVLRQTSHQFMVTVWYPAVAVPGRRPDPYLEPAVIETVFGNDEMARLAPMVGHSFANLLFATNQARWPVVLYSPSFRSYRRENVYKVEELASHGFVVIGLDHRTTVVSVFPDGEVVYGASVDATVPTYLDDIKERAADERFVLDQIAQWHTNDALFGGHLDLARVGAFGWSHGGATTAEFCRTDPRCKAGVNMDGMFWITNLITTPFLMLLSATPYATLPDGSDDRRPVIWQMSSNACLLTIDGTVHNSYSDQALLFDKETLQTRSGPTLPLHPLIDGERVNRITATCLVSFFKKYLLDEDDHLLDGPSRQFPEAIEFYRK